MRLKKLGKFCSFGLFVNTTVVRNFMRQSLLFIMLGLSLSGCGQKIRETFLVPAGFEGRINVIFNQPSSPPIPVAEGRKVYNIPTDGILVTSSGLEDGMIDQEFFYVDSLGKRTAIPVLEDGEKLGKEPKVVYKGANGVYGNSSDKNPLEFTEVIIASEGSEQKIFNPQALTTFQTAVKKKAGRSL